MSRQRSKECVGSANERAKPTAVQFSPACGNWGRSRETGGPGIGPEAVIVSKVFSVKVGIICEDKVCLLSAVGGMKTGRDGESTPCGSLLIGLITV